MALAVALLRSINVGGNRMKMDLLRDIAREVGLEGVRTVLASGNLIMECSDDLERARMELERALAERYGAVDVVVRAHDELRDAVLRNPFLARGHDGAAVHTMFLDRAPTAEAIAAIPRHDTDDRYLVDGHEVFVHYPDGAARSRYVGPFFERHLGVVGTLRNSNTVQRLVAATA